MIRWMRDYAQFFGFVILAIGVIIAFAVARDNGKQVLYETQLAACHRSNTLRVELNQRVKENAAGEAVLVRFLSSAADARLAAYEHTHNPTDLQAATEYRVLQAHAQATIHYTPVPLVNCQEVIQKP